MSRLFAFVAEFRERRISRILISYLAAGWVVLEVADHFVDRGIIPELAYRLTLLWYVAGIPACLIIGWFHGEEGDQKTPRLEVLMLSVLGVVCLGLSSTAVSDHRKGQLATAAEESGLDLSRVAVLYFEDITRGGELQYLADGLSEDLIGELERVEAIDVVSENGVAQFRTSDIPQDSIADLLEVGTVVDGTLERVGEKVRVNLRLIDASGAEFRRVKFERPLSDPLALRDDLAKETSQFLRAWLGKEIELRKLSRATESPLAWALYQRAEKARKDAEVLYSQGDAAKMSALFQQADALLVKAEAADASWLEPTLLRGRLAYRQSRLVQDPHRRVEWIEKGLAHAHRVLQKERNHAGALELRGTLNYWHSIIEVVADARTRTRLQEGARVDLERAVELDPSLASAYGTLSHMDFRTGDITAGVVKARLAYEEDAYLDVADMVLWRLAVGSYDLDAPVEAKRWCDEGGKRFPADYRFTHCQLLVMTTRVAEPNIEKAWQLLARQDSLVAPARLAFEHTRGEMLVSGVIARAGQTDSARAVLSRADARVTPELDKGHDLLYLKAFVLSLIGDVDGSIDALKRFAAVHPGSSFGHHWWWQKVRLHPRYTELPPDKGHH